MRFQLGSNINTKKLSSKKDKVITSMSTKVDGHSGISSDITFPPIIACLPRVNFTFLRFEC